MQSYRQLKQRKSKRSKLPLILIGLMVIMAGVLAYLWLKRDQKEANSNKPDKVISVGSKKAFNKQLYSLTDPISLWVIVNKNRPMPSDYTPDDLVTVNVPKHGDKSAEELALRQEAASALEQLISSAKTEGIDLAEGSGYRSYALQKFYYDNYVAQSGQVEADKFSARPGYSEHQTGLAADIAVVGGKCYLETCFADTPEGKWLAANAYKYGYIIRYPKGKESITGYQYEPWHVRYVGKDLANEIHNTGQTLEEYFGVN